MCAIVGNVFGGVIAFIITAVKSTLFFGGDALICGIGNWCANAVTGLLGISGGLGGLGGLGTLIGGWAWVPAIIGTISGVGGTVMNGLVHIWSGVIAPILSALAAALAAFLMGPI